MFLFSSFVCIVTYLSDVLPLGRGERVSATLVLGTKCNNDKKRRCRPYLGGSKSVLRPGLVLPAGREPRTGRQGGDGNAGTSHAEKVVSLN